jgi:hypothetical protein
MMSHCTLAHHVSLCLHLSCDSNRIVCLLYIYILHSLIHSFEQTTYTRYQKRCFTCEDQHDDDLCIDAKSPATANLQVMTVMDAAQQGGRGSGVSENDEPSDGASRLTSLVCSADTASPTMMRDSESGGVMRERDCELTRIDVLL